MAIRFIRASSHGQFSIKILWSGSVLEIGAFNQQLKTQMASGRIVQPEVAYVKKMEAT